MRGLMFSVAEVRFSSVQFSSLNNFVELRTELSVQQMGALELRTGLSVHIQRGSVLVRVGFEWRTEHFYRKIKVSTKGTVS